MSLRRFLDWFEGYAENIDKCPNDKQWQRIVSKITELQSAPQESAAVEQAQAEPIGGAGTTAWWKKQVLAELEEQGYDPESAKEVLAMIPIDLNADPQAVAARAAQGMS